MSVPTQADLSTLPPATRLTIPIPTPSLNELLRGGWKARHYGARERWYGYVCQAVHRAGERVSPADGKRAVTIERVGKRLLDHDNFVGGLKPAIDALKRVRLIRDDSQDWLELAATQRRCQSGEKPHTRITVTT